MVGQSSGPALPFHKLFTASAIAACTAEITTLPLGAPGARRVWGAVCLAGSSACMLSSAHARTSAESACGPAWLLLLFFVVAPAPAKA